MNEAIKNDDLEEQLNATRIKLYEQTKNMTSEEQVAFFNNRAREIMEQHGLKGNFVKAPIIRRQIQP